VEIKISRRVLVDGVAMPVPRAPDARVDFHTGRGQAWPWMGDGVAKPAAFNEV